MKEALTQSIDNLRTNKLRSFLTMFGIMWGVISIVILSAMGEGFQRGNQAVLEELGRNIVVIRNGRTSVQAGGERAGRVIRLNIGDVHELRNKSRLIQYVSPELMRGAVSVKSAYNAASLQMSGIWPEFQTIRTIEVSNGRLINEADNDDARRVVVIGREAATQLFADRDPIGEEVRLNGLSYTVIGRIRQKFQDSNYTGRDELRLFVPYEAMRRDFPLVGQNMTADSLSAIIAAPYSWVSDALREEFDRDEQASVFGIFGQTMVEKEIRRVLAPVKGFDADDREALSLWNTAVESVMFSKMMRSMKNFFLGVSLITLVLGGIGVMNIMLIAVRERTREIGLRKALGATSHSIHRQFIVEGLTLTMLSGALGLTGGWGLCRLINMLPMPARFSGMIITPGTGLMAASALAIVGLLAALYPATRAAALPPVESLRYEA
ncbi:MAG: ABC transporter permease [Acidobacteria bacterium]|nr:MAG: ABC transporter permease [Acidobacteriota bacterium]